MRTDVGATAKKELVDRHKFYFREEINGTECVANIAACLDPETAADLPFSESQKAALRKAVENRFVEFVKRMNKEDDDGRADEQPPAKSFLALAALPQQPSDSKVEQQHDLLQLKEVMKGFVGYDEMKEFQGKQDWTLAFFHDKGPLMKLRPNVNLFIRSYICMAGSTASQEQAFSFTGLVSSKRGLQKVNMVHTAFIRNFCRTRGLKPIDVARMIYNKK